MGWDGKDGLGWTGRKMGWGCEKLRWAYEIRFPWLSFFLFFFLSLRIFLFFCFY
jgi:hypothetical protein